MIILPILACRSLLLKSFLEPKIAMIEQMAQGLSLFGVLDMMRKHSSLLTSVFTFEGWHDITSEELIHLMVPQYSDEGTKMKDWEINVFKHLMDFITSLQYAGKELTYLICKPYYPSILKIVVCYTNTICYVSAGHQLCDTVIEFYPILGWIIFIHIPVTFAQWTISVYCF